MKKNRRSIVNFSVKREMQVKLFANCMLVSAVSIAIMGGLFYYYSSREIGSSYKQFHVEAKNFLDYLLPAVIGAIALGSAASFLIAVFFPHKIAGPVYRIEEDLKKYLAEGDLTAQFKLRNGDQMVELAETLNKTVDNLKTHMAKIKEPLEKLDSLLVQDNIPDNTELKKLTEKMKKEVDWFKI